MTFNEKTARTFRLASFALVALLAFAAVPQASAQPEAVKAKVPFAFTASGKTLPAGSYEFRVKPDDQVVSIQAKNGTPEVFAMILTYVSPRPLSGEENDSHIVFDKVGNTYILAEIWQPGFDGVILNMQKGKHEHHVIRVQHAPKS
ncbi:MAG: hypothetical protein KJZ70_14900 [Bryobacterales bacterium]|nr:hypothetical protein [Bryobacterales bacterium]